MNLQRPEFNLVNIKQQLPIGLISCCSAGIDYLELLLIALNSDEKLLKIPSQTQCNINLKGKFKFKSDTRKVILCM